MLDGKIRPFVLRRPAFMSAPPPLSPAEKAFFGFYYRGP